MAARSQPVRRHSRQLLRSTSGVHSPSSVARTRQNGRRCWTVGAFPGAGDGNFKGSYAKLVDFLRECHTSGCEALSDERFSDLLDAVEELSLNRHMMVSLPDLHRSETGVAGDVLESWGIHLQLGTDDAEGESGSSTDGDEEREEDAPQKPVRRTKTLPVRKKPPMQSDGVRIRNYLEEKTKVASFQTAVGDESPSVGSQQRPAETQSLLMRDASLMGHAFSTPMNIVERFAIPLPALRTWIAAIAEKYLDNPYHNWNHAMDVFFFSYYVLFQGDGHKYFTSQDILALLTSAIAHDVGHMGTTNAFLVKTSHELALVYNDQSPLEHMHSSVYFTTLARPGHDFISHLPVAERACFRTKIVEAILSTDMAHHFKFIDRFSARLSKVTESPFSSDLRDDEAVGAPDRSMLLQAFLHMADLGHTTRLWDLHKRQVVFLEQEFFIQGDKERELGVPIMPLMDRSKDSLASGQSTFLDVMVRPMLMPFTQLMCSDIATSMSTNFEDNRERWDSLVARHGPKTASVIIELDDDEDEVLVTTSRKNTRQSTA